MTNTERIDEVRIEASRLALAKECAYQQRGYSMTHFMTKEDCWQWMLKYELTQEYMGFRRIVEVK